MRNVKFTILFFIGLVFLLHKSVLAQMYILLLIVWLIIQVHIKKIIQ